MRSAPEVVHRYGETLADRCREVLHTDLVAAWFAGSVALDDFRIGRSDVDVVVAVAASLREGDKRTLVEAVDHRALACPARGLELVVYGVDQLRAGRAEPEFELELNDGPHMARRVTLELDAREATAGRFWYAIDLAISAQSGRPILGSEPAALVRPAEPNVLLRQLASSLKWHLESGRALHEDAVLNACRALRFARSRTWVSKSAAGRWMGPDSEVVRHALRARCEDCPPPTGAAVRDFVRAAMLELEQLVT